MPEPTACLQSYAEGIRSLIGAGSVTLFVPASASRNSQPLLHHCGTLDPIPELRDLEAARSFLDRRAGEEDSSDIQEPPVVVPSTAQDSGLIALPVVAVFGRPGWSEGTGERRRRSDTDLKYTKAGAWLGIRLHAGEGSILERLDGDHLSTEVARSETSKHWWSWLFFLGSALATHTTQVAALLEDPLTGLADRRQFQAALAEQLEEAREESSSVTLVFINPDDFASVNERFGREVGDRCVQEISERLGGILRGSDLIARYGGVIFVAILSEAPSETADLVARRLRAQLSSPPFADGEVHLNFSIGYSHIDLAQADRTVEPLELIRQADQALSVAKRSEGSSIQRWTEDSVLEEVGAYDRLAGIFTGNMTKDYRNMELLRDTANMIAVHSDFTSLAHEVVERLYSRLAPLRIGLYSRDEDGELRLVRGLTRSVVRDSGHRSTERVDLDAARHRLLSAALDQGEAQLGVLPVDRSDFSAATEEVLCFAIPLVAGEDTLGCLYLEGPGDSLLMEDSDLVFFKALASQLAVALDRARLAELESERRQAREEALQSEVRRLRYAVSQAQLVFRSPEMKRLVATAQRAAVTDATVLITGATGTGKELLARTIHELSPRGDKPFVVVDCGAIPSNLIESELFGHEKGAFTGADARRPGRLEAAGQGTVLLDEIGELPLEIQSRLLRFVQEKQFTRVGGSQVQQTGVRILAATNRDLGAEIEAGRFRADLYHRLRIIVLNLPPLRERPDDILLLAQHFLEAFRSQYQKRALRLSDAAEQWLRGYDWPGNVRELKNRILQAVVLAEDNLLKPADLGDLREASGPLRRPETVAVPMGEIASPRRLGGSEARWQELRDVVRTQLDEAVAKETIGEAPLVRLLGDEVIIRAHGLVNGIGRQAADLLDLPDTSCRRRFDEARKRRREASPTLTPGWKRVEQAIGGVLDCPSQEPYLWQRFEDCFLSVVLERFSSDARTAAALLGVGRRTFRKRAHRLRRSSIAPENQ